MDEKTERLRKMARDAIKEYGDATAGGSEPIYPAWADDLLEVLDAPVKRHPDVHDNNSVQVGFAPQFAASAESVGTVRHFQYSGIARRGFSQEAVLNDDAPDLPDGSPLYTAPVAGQPAANVEHRPLQPACPDELDKDLIDFKWREINRADDSWTPSPHVVLAQWAYGKGLHAAQPSVPDGLPEILLEAAAILSTIHREFPPRNMRWPIVDELGGFAAMLKGQK